jgi:hypothetical protein
MFKLGRNNSLDILSISYIENSSETPPSLGAVMNELPV